MEDDKEKHLDQAVDWMITLQDAPIDHSVRSEFEAWLAASHENKDAWQEISSTKNILSSVFETEKVELTKLKNINTSDQTPRHSSFLPLLRSMKLSTISAAFSLFFCVLYFSPLIMVYLKSDYMTGIGEVKLITLNDGSKVHLESEAAIKVQYQENTRIFQLLKGRVFFDVTSNIKRPFKVKSDVAEVTVLGTKF